MKKVFALFSVLTLAIMLFAMTSGIQSQAADSNGKWLEDPTLAEGEIPLYVAGSIATTFPQYFDYDAAKGTDFEDKAHRVGDNYPWNETKVLIPRYEGDQIVGTYSVYPFGGNSAKAAAAGQYIYTWLPDGESFKVNSTHGFTSLSQIRHNISGQDIVTMTSYTRTGEPVGKGSSVAHIVFDANGKATRGLLGAVYFEAPTEDATKPCFAPQFGYIDGEVVKIIDGDTSMLDRIWIETEDDDLTKPLLDEFGDPLTDEFGNPLYEKVKVETEDPALFYKRILWQYFDEKPDNVNEVPYLSEGWLATNWDYYDEETHLAYLFLEGDDGKFGTVNQQQADVHNASLGLSSGDEGFHVPNITTRQEFLYLRVPNGGTFYDLGYLERIADGGKDFDKFFEIYEQAYFYGRDDDYQMVNRAYNFSSKPIELVQTIQEGNGYMPLNDTNFYEILPGTTFKPSWVVNIDGMLGGFTDLNDIFSYKNLSETDLDIEVDLNGKRIVYDFFKDIRYDDKDEMTVDFLSDFYEFLCEHPSLVQADVDISDVNVFMHGADGTGYDGTWVQAMQDYIMWEGGAARPTGPDNSKLFFINQEAYYDKWIDLFDVFHQVIINYGGAGLWGTGAYVPTRRVNLYIQNNPVLGEDNLNMMPEGWIYKPHEYYYDTFNEMVTEFLTDFYNYCVVKEYVVEAEVSLSDFMHGVDQTEGFGGLWQSKLGTTSGDATYGIYPLWGHYEPKPDSSSSYFFGENANKWMWLLDHFETVYVEGGVGISWWNSSSWTPVTKFKDYLLGNLVIPNPDNLEEKDITIMPIYVVESGYVETFPPAFREMIVDTTGANLNTRYVVDYRVYNKATELSSSKQVIFIVTDCYTPLLEIDNNKLFVEFDQTSIDLYSIAKAYDRNYDEVNKNIKGWEISQNIKFDYSPNFDPNNLTPGKHEINVSITSGSKMISKRVFINVPDTVKPVVETRDLYLPNGADFNPVDGIKFAYDNLDGNLFNANYRWYVVLSGDDINTNQPGEYPIELEVFDKSGNSRVVQYTVYVGEKEVDPDQIIDDITSDIVDRIDELEDGMSSNSSCQTTNATYFISIILALSTLIVVFRRRQF